MDNEAYTYSSSAPLTKDLHGLVFSLLWELKIRTHESTSFSTKVSLELSHHLHRLRKFCCREELGSYWQLLAHLQNCIPGTTHSRNFFQSKRWALNSACVPVLKKNLSQYWERATLPQSFISCGPGFTVQASLLWMLYSAVDFVSLSDKSIVINCEMNRK